MKKIFYLFLFVLPIVLSAQDNDQFSSQQSNSFLAQPISVTIGGDFIVTGSFPGSQLQRLDNFITTIYLQAQQNTLRGLNQVENIKQVKQEMERYALRNITLKRINGQNRKIDLLKFRLTGDFENNPYLMQDDLIIFPAYDAEKYFVEISGAINKFTKFQFVEGDKLSDAILFAGGLNNAYQNIEKAEISRLNTVGTMEELIVANIKDDYILQSGDRIRILADENHKKNFKVMVLGEVKYPGFVYITKGGSLLSDVIEKAGGFNPNADLIRSEVVRNYNSIETLRKYQLTKDYLNNPELLLKPELQLALKQKKEAFEMLRTTNLTVEDTTFFYIDNQLRILHSECLVDFTKLENPDSDENKFLVKDGDLILVPDKFDYIYVFGQVSKAGYVKYQNDGNYAYYIEKAGGKTETASDNDEVVVIKEKGKDWITKEKEKIKIEPGDFVYVPKEIPHSFWFHISRVGAIAGILGSIATIVLLFK